jgi:hypothetical protein
MAQLFCQVEAQLELKLRQAFLVLFTPNMGWLSQAGTQVAINLASEQNPLGKCKFTPMTGLRTVVPICSFMSLATLSQVIVFQSLQPIVLTL